MWCGLGLLGVVVVMVVDVVVAGTPIEVEKKLVSIEMKENEEKKTYLGHSFGPYSSLPPSISLPIATPFCRLCVVVVGY